ncbi:MAG: chloride channel protein, partial [Rhodoferax sp.]|nr:chloride channel protein [Rhodoferax sp.]
MNSNINHADILRTLRAELVNWRAWTGRLLVMAFAALAGLTVVAFTWMTEQAFGLFEQVQQRHVWWPLLW